MRLLSRAVFGAVAALAAIVVTAATAFAAAPPTYQDTVSGVEYSATPTEGKFAGYAAGMLPGLWNADVVHDQLTNSQVAISRGGSFTVASTQTVRGTFTGGTITPTPGQTGCTQTFQVVGYLGDVGPVGGRQHGTGTFTATLTHYGFPTGSGCFTYAATVSGTVDLRF